MLIVGYMDILGDPANSHAYCELISREILRLIVSYMDIQGRSCLVPGSQTYRKLGGYPCLLSNIVNYYMNIQGDPA